MLRVVPSARVLGQPLLKFCCAAASTQSGESILPFSAIPGPKGWPLLGNIMELRRNMQHYKEYYHDCFEKYGEIFKISALGSSIVFIKDPDGIEQILRAEGKYPVRDTVLTSGMEHLAKKANHEPSFAFINGEKWKHKRTAFGKQATPRNVQTYIHSFNLIFDRFMNYIRNTRGSDGTIDDLAMPLKLLLTEISAKFVYDTDIEVVSDPSGEFTVFANAVGDLLSVIGRVGSELPLYKFYDTNLSKKYKECQKVLDRVSKNELEKLKRKLEKGLESETPGLVEQWLKEGKISEEEAIAEAKNMFVAGVDTTANQSAFLMYQMAKNPDVQEKLYEEIHSVVGDSKWATTQQLPQMPYLKGCILESFRLCSTIPVFVRVAAEDAVLHGYRIPAKVSVFYSLYSAGRDERLFQDPLNFDPARWKRDETHAFAIQPFGFGPRGCYGRRFAEYELKLLLVQMALNFKLSTPLTELKTIDRAVTVPDGLLPITFMDR